jgi:hypothetical protein
MNMIFVPQGIPVVRRINSRIAQKLRTLPHALLEFNGERNQRGQRQFKTLETTERKSYIEGARRFASVPALACRDLTEQPAN